jgi:hypothetical protein
MSLFHWVCLFGVFYFSTSGCFFVALRDPSDSDEFRTWPALFIAVFWPIVVWFLAIWLIVSALKNI